MTPLPEHKIHFWGEDHIVIPYLLDAIHGDGKKWIYFAYLDDRPWFYAVRIDSAIKLDNDNFYEEVLDWIHASVEDEAMEFMTDDQLDQWESEDDMEDRPWPIPPRNPCGSEWDNYTPTKEDLEIAKR